MAVARLQPLRRPEMLGSALTNAMNPEALYARLPIPLQNAACAIEGWRIEHVRLGRRFNDLRASVDSRTFLDPDAAAALRDARLRAFLAHAVNSVPYYRLRFDELGLDVRAIHGLEDLRSLPVLEKADVQDHLPRLVSGDISRRGRVLVHTSGSTGGGLRFYTTHAAVREQWATYWRCWGWHGIRRGELCAFFGGRSVVPISQKRPPYWRESKPQRRIFFSAHHMTPENLDAYVAELGRRRPLWIHGYPSLIALLASHIVESGTDLGYTVNWVTTGAENLAPQQAAVIEQAFGVRPTQHYGSTEAVAQFSECELGSLHVDEDFAAVEFVDDEAGHTRVIGTNFTDLATPLIRYDVGDFAKTSQHVCPCGRPGRVVATIDGRLEDYLVLANGARVAALNHIFKDMVRVREAQLYQRVPAEVTVRIVPTDDFSEEDEKRLSEETRKRVGDDTVVQIERVESLPRTRNGKLSLVVSDVVSSSARSA